jgi:SecD/SecF fusion protein
MFAGGFSLGVDFQGGRSYVVQMPKDIAIADVRTALTKEFIDGAPEVKTYDTNDKFKITTAHLAKENGEEVDAKVLNKVYKGLQPLLAGASEKDFASKNILSSQKVGPTIVDDIKASAGLSTLLAIVAIALYILIRFRKWEYSLGAIIAMAHDVLVILAIYAIFWRIMPFSMDIDQAFIAALLTIAGYSINDTVVVYDRLREYIGLKRKGTLDETIADAVNSTLSRTLVTAVTTAITVLFLFFMGGEVLRSFSFAILVGLVVGTYSSIFIASSVVLDIQKRNESKLLGNG